MNTMALLLTAYALLTAHVSAADGRVVAARERYTPSGG